MLINLTHDQTEQLVIADLKESIEDLWKLLNHPRYNASAEDFTCFTALVKVLEYYGVDWVPEQEASGMETY